MAYRCRDMTERGGGFRFRAVEVVLVERDGLPVRDAAVQVLAVDNQWETLRYVQENMVEVVANMVMVKRMDLNSTSAHVDENARLFEKSLEPLFSMISATATEHVMDKLSGSLKKALLMMAIERYGCDGDRICRALGISRGKLEKELRRCGLMRLEKKAA